MEKLSRKQRDYAIRVNRKRYKRRLVSKAKAAIARGARPRGSARIARKARQAPGLLRVLAPERFLLEAERPRSQLMGMLDTVRHHVVRRGRAVRIDFSRTREMFPSGTLLFLAELDRIRALVGGRRRVFATYPTAKVVEQVFYQVGILSRLGLASRVDPEQFPDNVRHWRCVTNTAVMGEEVAPIVAPYKGVLAESLTKGLYAGIVEAMSNSVQHAYEGPRADGLDLGVRGWWMFSQEIDGNLTVALCDLGIGIPVSLPASKKWSREVLEGILSRVSLAHPDASWIKEVVELQKTRTGEEHRGKGLGEILDVVRRARSGYLRIMSNHGLYGFKGETRQEDVRDLRRSIMGTIVLWTIPLEQ